MSMRCEMCQEDSNALTGVPVFCGGGFGWTTMWICGPCNKTRNARIKDEEEKALQKKALQEKAQQAS